LHGRSEGGIVLILTTYESDDQILAAIEAGATGYLLKAAPESEILAGVRATARGNSNPAIGRALFLSEATVKTHLGHVFEKLGVNDRTRAVTRAMELQLLPRVPGPPVTGSGCTVRSSAC